MGGDWARCGGTSSGVGDVVQQIEGTGVRNQEEFMEARMVDQAKPRVMEDLEPET